MPAVEKPSSPKTLLICKSVHHGNTARVADRIASVLGADIFPPEAVPYTSVDHYDLLGFGSGIYYGRFHDALWDWLRGLPENAISKKPAFIFSTAGLSLFWKHWHGSLKKELSRRGFDVIGDFHCRGFDSWGPLGIIGGINRRHPDERDLARAEAFARDLKAEFAARLAHAGVARQAALRAG